MATVDGKGGSDDGEVGAVAGFVGSGDARGEESVGVGVGKGRHGFGCTFGFLPFISLGRTYTHFVAFTLPSYPFHYIHSQPYILSLCPTLLNYLKLCVNHLIIYSGLI